MKNVVIKPLGKVLKQAGLISDFQLRTVLEIQSKNNQVKFGTILVSQGILKQKTVDFFAEQLPKLLQQPRTKPLGYYLQEASLIDAQQIQTLLKEQKLTKRLLGELLVEKKLLKKKTINFFLQYLGRTETKVKLFSPSNQEIITSLNLDTKAAAPYSLLKEVFYWTGGHPLLTREICRIISDSNYFVSAGLEAVFVEKLVQERVIHNWDNQALGEYFKTIQHYLLNNTSCSPITLLRLYLQIWRQGEISTNQSREKKELIKLGLIVERENKLRVANRLYQSIFNPDWVKKQLLIREKKSRTAQGTQLIDSVGGNPGSLYAPSPIRRGDASLQNTLSVPPTDSAGNLLDKPIARSNLARKTTPHNRQISTATQIKNEPLTQIGALTIFSGLLIISPLIIFFNNLQYKLSKENNSLDVQSLSKSILCIEPIPAEESAREDWRLRLEQEQQRLQEQFPDSCQNNLDKLIIMKALQLGKENRVLDGIQSLCQISATSESFNQAKLWLSRWYNSADWGEPTKSYLSFIGDCPAAEKLSAKF